MIIEFSIKNFRSIKDEAILSFQANSSKSKDQNYFVANTESEDFKLTKSIAIYGANASGKSNIIIAFHALLYLVRFSDNIEVESSIPCYEPFLFDNDTKDAPCEFSIVFIVRERKYKLEVGYTKHEIVKERLIYYATKKETVLYERTTRDGISHDIKFGRKLSVGRIKKEVLSNQLYLTKFMTDIHHILTPICAYLKTIEIEISHNNPYRAKALNESVAENIVIDGEGSMLKSRLHKLMNIADIQVADIQVKEVTEDSFKFPDNFPTKLKKKIIDDNKWNIEFLHKSYSNNMETGLVGISLEEESLGTQILFGLGARILQTLEKGGILVYDELDNSLHPRLSRLLVQLFNNDNSNPANAQLIFSTHEVSIIDKDILRSDQIWFVEKNNQGASDLFSAQDFTGIREDMPFDKWYQAGRFGGLPTIGDIDHIFE